MVTLYQSEKDTKAPLHKFVDAPDGTPYKHAAMFKPVHALVGADLFLQLEKLAEIVRAAPADAQRIDADGETVELASVLDELRSFAMFSSAKIVVVRDADTFISRFRESLEKYVAKPSAGSMLVLRVGSLPANQRIHKLIAAAGLIHDCNAPKDVSRWIVEHAKRAHALTVRPDAARMLADFVGNDLGRLDNDLAKIALQSDGPVDTQTVVRNVAFQREQEMWDMTNQVATGNTTDAVRRWRQLVQLDSSAEYRAVTWLVMWLEKVRKALAMRRDGAADATIARDLKIWPFDQQRPFFQTVTTIGDTGARRLIDLLAEIDYRSKTGLGEMADNVERFLMMVKK